MSRKPSLTAVEDEAPGYVRYPRFAENGSIRTWFTVWIGLLAPATGFVSFCFVAVNNNGWMVAPFFICMLFWLLSIGVRANWGVGIRIDDNGIRIGGCKRTSRWWWRAWEKIRLVSGPTPARPTTYTLHVPWDGITSVRVITDHKDMRHLIRTAPRNTYRYSNSVAFRVGVMMPLFALIWRHWALRGFLVFDVDLKQAQMPQFRKGALLSAMPPSSTWICPVKHTKRLQKAVDQLQPLLNR